MGMSVRNGDVPIPGRRQVKTFLTSLRGLHGRKFLLEGIPLISLRTCPLLRKFETLALEIGISRPFTVMALKAEEIQKPSIRKVVGHLPHPCGSANNVPLHRWAVVQKLSDPNTSSTLSEMRIRRIHPMAT
ncbi:hypothetical protein HNY73_000022 [Argiope bruennichi]|uniref:Uncharacterized protein n=1 Tax=Argiope bruennichi TaxID=94029 RepID=A0A8T0FWS7_ARGBR|nr:hypothetical protein HNY73_000022 [Argiope bruennichi]